MKKANFQLVRLNETKYWELDSIPGHEKITGVFCVYLYNAAEVTHYCEITPSYCLIPLYSYAATDGATDEENETIHEAIADGHDGEPRYYHCSSIDKIAGANRHEIGDWEGDFESPEEREREVVEHYTGNWCL